jgi:hypothetical protein
MRGVTHADAVAAASLLLRAPRAAWESTLEVLFMRAHAADLYRKRLGRIHPRWGNGSLVSTVLCDSSVWPEHRLSDPAYAEALVAVLTALIRRHQRSS